jgi:hypothetical protein
MALKRAALSDRKRPQDLFYTAPSGSLLAPRLIFSSLYYSPFIFTHDLRKQGSPHHWQGEHTFANSIMFPNYCMCMII